MKFKILSVVTIILAVLWSTNVYAASYNGYIYEDTKIPGIYYYKHRSDTETEKYEYHNFHSQAAIHRRSSDRAIVYCIESWKTLSGSGIGDFSEVSNKTLTNLTNDQIDRIQKLAYFGYGYTDATHNHQDLKWYAITQYMIWLTQAPNIEHYFVNSMTSTTPINMFDSEIQELNALVDSVQNQVTIQKEEKILLGKSQTIKIDDLASYEIDYQGNIAIEPNYDNNTIEVIPIKQGNSTITFTKRYNRTGKAFKYYLSDEYQNTMSIGDIDDRVINYNIVAETATIEIKIYEEDTETQEKKILEGWMYGICAKNDIYINGQLIEEKDRCFTSDTPRYNGAIRFNGLSAGEYYIKELFYMGAHYYDTKKVINVQIDEAKTVYEELNYHRQKLKINLKKYLYSPIVNNQELEYSLLTKEGIKFGLFNEEGEMVAEATSDSTGNVEFSLAIPYGYYYLKEISTLDNYYLSDFVLPITFECRGNTEYQSIGSSLELINYHKKGELNITKKDKDTKKPLAGVKFAIYNTDKEIVKIIKTDNQGKINLTLPYGNYYIQELETLENYELDDTLIPFSITSETQNMEFTNKKEEIKIDEEIKEEIKIDENILTPNLKYEPIEVELSKTDANSFIKGLFYIITIFSLMIYRYVKKIAI